MDKVKLEKTKIHQKYLLADGREVVGVTTALGIMNKPALLAWAWAEGKAGRDFRKVKDQAADIGTLAHFLCECHLKGIEADTSEFSPADLSKAENAVIKFMTWWDKEGFTLVASESQLISEQLEYGGTLDIVAKDKEGVLHLIDIKTSKAIYEEYWFQVAAYRKLWNENNLPENLIKGATYIVRIGKEANEDDFETPSRTDLSREFDVFLKCLALYKAVKENKKKG